MAVMWPAFAERVFEFSFNAEYANANKAILAGTPQLPTQNEEKYLGYDVAFEVQSAGGVVNTVALQHKTSRYVDAVSGSNWHFRSAAGVPYFAFRIDVAQFNVIEEVASAGMPGVEIYYCAPLFTTLIDMDTHYMGQTVSANSVWIDVSGVGQLDPSERHTIVYSASHATAWVCSEEPRPLKVLKPRRARKEGSRYRLSREILRENYERIRRSIDEKFSGKEVRRPSIEGDGVRKLVLEAPRQLTATSLESEELRATRDLLANYLGASVLIETVLDPALPSTHE